MSRPTAIDSRLEVLDVGAADRVRALLVELVRIDAADVVRLEGLRIEHEPDAMGTAFARAVYPLHTSRDEDEAPRRRNCGRGPRAACPHRRPRRPPCRASSTRPAMATAWPRATTRSRSNGAGRASGSAGTPVAGPGRRSGDTSPSRATRSVSPCSRPRPCGSSPASGSRPEEASRTQSPGHARPRPCGRRGSPGAVVTSVDPLAGRIVTHHAADAAVRVSARPPARRACLLARRRATERARRRSLSWTRRARPGVVDSCAQARVGSVGLAVDPVGRKAYLAEGERVFTVDLRTLAVSDPGPLRTLAKVTAGLGAVGALAWERVAGGLRPRSRCHERHQPAGLRLVDVRDRTTRTIDPTATSFTVAGRVLLVEKHPKPPGAERDRLRLRRAPALPAGSRRARGG